MCRQTQWQWLSSLSMIFHRTCTHICSILDALSNSAVGSQEFALQVHVFIDVHAYGITYCSVLFEPLPHIQNCFQSHQDSHPLGTVSDS
jgi:hypothetical protein